MSGGRTGGKGKLYYDTSGAGQGTWTEAYGVKLANTKGDWNTTEHEDRDEDLVTVSVSTRKYEISGTINYKPDNASAMVTWNAFLAAFNNAETSAGDIGLFAADKPLVSGNTSIGVQGDFKITSLGRDEPLKDGMEVPFTAMLSADSAFAHGWASVATA